MISFARLTSSEVHWRLIDATASRDDALDASVSDDGFVAAQELFCPYYATLDGALGSDWGVIVNPESAKFGQVVFEHHWCGCPVDADGYALHGEGEQCTDEWRVPACHDMHKFRNDTYEFCLRERNHRGTHQGRVRSWR